MGKICNGFDMFTRKRPSVAGDSIRGAVADTAHPTLLFSDSRSTTPKVQRVGCLAGESKTVWFICAIGLCGKKFLSQIIAA